VVRLEGLVAERSRCRCLAGGGVEEEGRFGGLLAGAGPIVSVSASGSGARRFTRLETD
jgi:hypothetical protein